MDNHKTKDEWEEAFLKWKSTSRKRYNYQEEKIDLEKPTLIKKEELPEKIFLKRNKPLVYLFSLLAIIVLLFGYLALKINISNVSFSFLVISIFILTLVFFTIFFAHIVYERLTHFMRPSLALAFSYALIIANMFMSPRVYSVEWAFLGFLAIAIISYDFKIDSRFLILPALILLGYIPFLLIGAQKEIAEIVAVYVYYFLVVGVGLQIVEYSKKTKNSIDFNRFIETFISKEKILQIIPLWGVITLAIIIHNRFRSVELLKWSSVYIFVILLVFYAIAYFQEQKQYTTALE